MSKAIGMAEYKTVATGVQAADLMIKTADIEVVTCQTVCPGKYIIIVTGDLSSVRASVDAAKTRFGEQLISDFVLGNPDEAIFPAIYGAVEVENKKALGVIETFDAASAIVAADMAAKTSDVQLIELRLAKGMCGKSYLYITGDVAAVSAAVEKAKDVVADRGMYLDSSVIASPDQKLWQSIL